MTTITRESLRQLRTEIEAALVGIGMQHDLTIEVGNANYSDGYASFKLKISEIRDGVACSKEVNDFRSVATAISLKPTDLGVLFEFEGMTFKLTGFNSRSRLYPMLVENDLGVKYSLPMSEKVLSAIEAGRAKRDGATHE